MNKKKIIIGIAIVLVVVVSVAIYIPIYKINKVFTYDIDKKTHTVTITGYLADEKVKDLYWKGEGELVFAEKIEVPKKIKGYPVTAIGEDAFACVQASEIVLPDTVVTIEKNAFRYSENLKAIKGTHNVEMIGDYAFFECNQLEELDMTSVRQIGEVAFANCAKLKSVIIPKTMREIPDLMCMGMDTMETVVIPEGVENIHTAAFAKSVSLDSVYVPSSVTFISDDAFLDIEEQITIYGKKGSYAEQYALDNGIKFEEWE